MGRKSKVKFHFNKVRSRVIPILRRVEVGEYPAKIARIYGWSRQHVWYYIRKLEACKLIRKQVRSSAVFYELTGTGKKFLASCEGVVFGSGVFRLHRAMVKFPVLREGVYPVGGFREVELVNWCVLLGLEQGVKVRKTTRHWIVHVETLYGCSPGELVVLALNLAGRVAESLCLKYGCVLGEPVLARGYELGVDDPVARLLSPYFSVSTGVRKMDHSFGVDLGEIDHLGRDAAVEYLLMPERVKKVEAQVTRLGGQFDDLRGELAHFLHLVNSSVNGVVLNGDGKAVKKDGNERLGLV